MRTIVLAFLFVYGATGEDSVPVQDLIRAHRIELYDSKGNPGILLASDEGNNRIVLYKDEKPHLFLSSSANGTAIIFAGKNGVKLTLFANEDGSAIDVTGVDGAVTSIPAKKTAPAAPATRATVAVPSLGSGHWVNEVSGNGRFVELEDGSLWEIESLDRIDTALWLPVTDITIASSGSPTYPYLLINKDDGERAFAKLISK